MQITRRPAIDPRRPITVRPAVEEPRYVEQQRAAQQMLTRMKTNAKLAAIMLNPIFAPQANYIVMQATGRAIRRYETEVPQKDFNVLMDEEQARADAQILALPQTYYDATADAARATGDAIVTGARVTGQAAATGAAAVAGGVLAAVHALFRGLGSVLSWVGGLYQGAGSKLTRWGES